MYRHFSWSRYWHNSANLDVNSWSTIISNISTFRRTRMRYFQIKLFDWILITARRKMLFSESTSSSRISWTKLLIWSFFNFSYRNVNNLINLFRQDFIVFHSIENVSRRINFLYESLIASKFKIDVLVVLFELIKNACILDVKLNASLLDINENFWAIDSKLIDIIDYQRRIWRWE
jgi:hypothetical protein